MTNTAWRVVLVMYVAFWFLAIAVERHGFATFFGRAPMTAFELFITVPFFWGYVIYSLQMGFIHWTSRWRPITIERNDSPLRYWLVLAFHFLYGTILIVLGLNR